MPVVSVVIPMRNAESFVLEALKSVLAENEVPLEIIVVDDKSTDASAEIVRSAADGRIRLLNGPGRGIAACLNAGFNAANGTLIMRCDADDRYPPRRIRQQVEWMQSRPEFDAVCGAFATMDSQGKLIANLNSGDTFADITEELLNASSRTSLCTYAMRRSAVQQTSGFREYFETAEDLDYQFRLAEVGRIAYLPDINYYYRIHTASTTHSQANDRRVFFESTAKSFSVQRRVRGCDALQDGTPPSAPLGDDVTAEMNSRDHIQGILLGRAWTEYAAGHTRVSLGFAARALSAAPSSKTTWKSVLVLLLRMIAPL